MPYDPPITSATGVAMFVDWKVQTLETWKPVVTPIMAAVRQAMLCLRVGQVRAFHESLATFRKSKKTPKTKLALNQPKIETDWVAPTFGEVAPAPTLKDTKGVDWNILVASCFSRYARITPDKTKEEVEFAAFKEKVCYICSIQSEEHRLTTTRWILERAVFQWMKFVKSRKESAALRTQTKTCKLPSLLHYYLCIFQ
jgi:hypothetical protein